MSCVFASTMCDDPTLQRRATAQCVALIFRVTERQRLPLTVASTASILFHRFYEVYTFEEYERFHVAVACCCLAAKIEFRGLSFRELVLTCLEERYDRERHPERFQEPAFTAFRRRLHGIEQILLLDIFHFDFDVGHPLTVWSVQRAVQYIQGPHAALAELLSQTRIDDAEQPLVHQVAWSLANDSAYTTLSLRFSPPHVAPPLHEIAPHGASQLARGLLHLAMEWTEIGPPNLGQLWGGVEDGWRVREEVRDQMAALYVTKSES